MLPALSGMTMNDKLASSSSEHDKKNNMRIKDIL
jgi:hypothetical protein